MEYVKIEMRRTGYMALVSSSEEMSILGCFFTTDVGCMPPYWDEWVLNDDEMEEEVNTNLMLLEKEGSYIYLSNLYDERKSIVKLKILRNNLLQLLQEWREKVCISKPKYILITHDNNIVAMSVSNRDDLIE